MEMGSCLGQTMSLRSAILPSELTLRGFIIQPDQISIMILWDTSLKKYHSNVDV